MRNSWRAWNEARSGDTESESIPMPARQPALIFDFGNVVAYFDYALACDRLGSRLGIAGAAFLERLRGAGFDALVRAYECGKIPCRSFSEQACRMAGLGELDHDEFASAWCDIFDLNEPVSRLLGTLNQNGYTLVLGSNTNAMHAARFRAQFATTLAHFDRLVLSFELGHAKPDKEFFVACADAAGCAPIDCVFIDDLASNVAGACAAGMTALLYRDALALADDLKRLGIQV
jgi:putative hydrolase of the HAD superfamily